MSKEYPLNVPAPHHFTFAVRDIPDVTVEQRERVLKATHYNEFAFPAGMLTVDMLSDSGTTAMTNQQWASLFLGDEAYGRNTGYYVLLDTFRDIFERGGEKNWKKIIDYVRTDCRDVETMMENVYLPEYEGGLFNGGAAQMERPNTFIIQQGRAAESVLMEIVKKILAQRHPGKVFTRSQIQEYIWGESDADCKPTNNITVFVRKIREKIEENPSEPKYLLTVQRVGYKMADTLE